MRFNGLALMLVLIWMATVFLCWWLKRRWDADVHDIIDTLDEHDVKSELSLVSSKYAILRQLLYSLKRWHDRVRKYHQEIVEENQRLKAIFNSATIGLIVVNERLYVEAVNPVAADLFNIVSDIHHRYILEVICNVRLESLLRYVIINGQSVSSEIEARDSQQKILRAFISPLYVDGIIRGAVVSVEDITELKCLDRVKAELVANMSHEIKTPLTSIKGFTETLLGGAMDDKNVCRRFLTIIDSEADRLTRLINDSLTLSRLESQDQDVDIEPVKVDDVIRNVLDMLDAVAQNKNIDINLYEDNAEITIDGNTDRLHQLILNLVDNAIKYTPAGGKVSISVYDKNDNAVISVKDTGIGIAKEHIPRLFERFYRVDKGRSRSMGGTGLGLAIVKHVVMSMNGKIDVKSELGKGTEFIVTLPKHYKPLQMEI